MVREWPQEIFEQVRETIARSADIDPAAIQPDSELLADLQLDSLAMYEIVVDLEAIYGLQISDEDISRLNTVGDACAYIDRGLREQSGKGS